MIGLLWYDDDPKVALAEKVRRAARCYRERHGRPATLVMVDAQELEGPATVDVDGAMVRVEPAGNMPRHHLLVGEMA